MCRANAIMDIIISRPMRWLSGKSHELRGWSPVDMTRALDAVDELFTITEGPTTEEGSSLERVKAKSAKDNLEGWITIKGNAGTVYAKVTWAPWSPLQAPREPRRNPLENDESLKTKKHVFLKYIWVSRVFRKVSEGCNTARGSNIEGWGVLTREIVSFHSCLRTRGLVA